MVAQILKQCNELYCNAGMITGDWNVLLEIWGQSKNSHDSRQVKCVDFGIFTLALNFLSSNQTPAENTPGKSK